jgi:amidase
MANLTVPGVLTRRVDDAAALYDVLAPGVPGWGGGLGGAVRRDPGRLRIGVAATLGSPARVDAEVRAAVAQVAEALRSLGHEIIPVTVRPGRWEVPFSIIGLRVLAEQARVVEDPTVLEGRTRAAMRLAALIPDRLGRWATTRQQRSRAAGRVFDGVDLILTPTLSAPPPPVGTWEGMGLLRTSFGVIRLCPFTSLWNYLGLPAATIPAGFTAAGLPVGAQLLGPADGEPALVAVAAQLEAALGWLARRPAV